MDTRHILDPSGLGCFQKNIERETYTCCLWPFSRVAQVLYICKFNASMPNVCTASTAIARGIVLQELITHPYSYTPIKEWYGTRTCFMSRKGAGGFI